MNKEILNLTKEGKRLITMFIEQNKKKEIKMRKQENDKENKTFRKIKKKKPLWLNTMKRIEFFGEPLIDFKHEFIKPKTTKHSINQPGFRRPKEKGDYFNKDMYIFGNYKNY